MSENGDREKKIGSSFGAVSLSLVASAMSSLATLSAVSRSASALGMARVLAVAPSTTGLTTVAVPFGAERVIT